jgi:clan AA aspartic protease (TIGR02281 family)
MMKRLAATVFLATFAAACAFTLPTAIASDYTDGMQLYKNKDYRGAAAKFEAAMRSQAGNPNVIYYCALSQQMANNRARARQLYEYLSANYPTSSVAPMAQSALTSLGGVSTSSGGGSSSAGVSRGGGGSEPEYLRGLQDEIRVPLMRRSSGQSKAAYVEVSINGRPVTFHLDTGAGSTVIGANQLEAMGMTNKSGADTFEIRGVGDREKSKGWIQKVDLKCGQVYRRDFRIMVQDEMEGEPLLGQDFLNDFSTTVDESAGQVIFRKKSAGVASRVQPRGTKDIPFTVDPNGRHILVDTLVNGRKYVMYFDTGADGIVFGFNDLKKLGIPAPDGPPDGKSKGVLGDTNTWVITLDSLKVGAVTQEGVRATVVENSKMEHPLLGQAFFGGYRYTVDTNAKVIHLQEQ